MNECGSTWSSFVKDGTKKLVWLPSRVMIINDNTAFTNKKINY